MPERFCIDSAYRGLLAANGLDSFAAIMSLNQGERLDKAGLESWRQRWRIRLTGPDGDTRTFYLKRFARPPLRRQIERWRGGDIRRSTARVECENAVQLAHAGVRVPRAISVGERTFAGWEQGSFVLLEEVQGQSLERMTAGMQPTGLTATPQAIESLARFAAHFHQAGFVHRDFYLSHIFIAAGGRGDDPGDYILIDLQRVFRPRLRRRRWIAKDLAAVAFSAPAEVVGRFGRLRFLARYVREFAGAGQARSIARSVGIRIERMRRRKHASKASRDDCRTSNEGPAGGSAAPALARTHDLPSSTSRPSGCG
jgi:hypothetical protein